MEEDEIEKLIGDFISGNYKFSVKKSLTEEDRNKKYIYNEISFQHELGIFLREKLKDKYLIQFERNIGDFGYNKDKLSKKEIDIVLIGKGNNGNCLIELKYHAKEKTRYHDTTADCVNDIKFVHNIVKNYKEHIKENEKCLRFKKGYCVTVVTDKNFYKTTNREKSSNYYCFRDIDNKFDGKVTYSGKNKNKVIDIDELIDKGYLPIRENIRGKKNTGWVDIYNEAKYYIVEI